MNIRHATNADTERLMQMTQRFVESTPAYWDLALQLERIEALIEAVLESGLILVAEVEEPQGTRKNVVAMLAIAALTHPLTGKRYGEELAWWVEPEDRKSGIGDRLLDAGEQWCRDNRLTCLKMVAPVGTGIDVYYGRRGYKALETAHVKQF